MIESPGLYLVPVIFFFITIAYYAYWVAISSFLFSSGTISEEPKSLPWG